MFDFVNQLTIDGKEYTAYRNSEKPRQCKIVRGDEEYLTTDLKSVWNAQTLPTIF